MKAKEAIEVACSRDNLFTGWKPEETLKKVFLDVFKLAYRLAESKHCHCSHWASDQDLTMQAQEALQNLSIDLR